MKKNRKGIIITIIAIAAVAAIIAAVIGKKAKAPKIVFNTVTVAKGDISSFVTATGTVEPMIEVEVGTQVSGIIDQIYVDYNSIVKQGQLIAEMDKVTLQSELESAQAMYDGNKAEYEYQEKNYRRNKMLFEKQMISESEYETSEYNYRMAKSSMDNSKASLDKARRNLSYATITSPIDGVVIDRAVEEGQTVAAGFETPTLFTIAADLTQMQVVADVDEADIGGVKEGQRVEFTVDAYPGDTFGGQVTQIRLGSSETTSGTSTTTESVITYEVVISAQNPDLKLKPRLTANVTIYTLDKPDVVSVPAKALRFKPEPPLVNDEYTVIDCDGEPKLWTLDGMTFTAHKVETGLSNGIRTEILSGLPEGTNVVEEATLDAPAPEIGNGNSERSPFMPGPPDRNKKSDKK